MTRSDGKVLVEVAVESVEGAVAAVDAGAQRIELCAALVSGGLTPSVGLCQAVCRAVDVPVFAMLRPRAGDFLYDPSELDVLERDLGVLGAAGAQGFVAGALTAEGRVDRAVMERVVRLAEGLPVTCHRAFDLTRDVDEAVEDLCAVGVARVLSSGQAATAFEGRALLRRVVRVAAGRLVVMAGAGVRASQAVELVEQTGVRELHLSAGRSRPSGMAFRREGVPMGASSAEEEYRVRFTSGELVAELVRALP